MRALSEVAAMVQKAALGAGIPLGQAEDLGRVAVYIAGTGGDLRVISDALIADSSPCVKWDHEIIRVNAGPAALIAPIIRDAFAMGVARAELADAGHAGLVKATLAVAGYDVDITDCLVTLRAPVPPAQPVGPVAVPARIWDGWAVLAAKTYVPESDASRLAGAGAGLTDND